MCVWGLTPSAEVQSVYSTAPDDRVVGLVRQDEETRDGHMLPIVAVNL